MSVSDNHIVVQGLEVSVVIPTFNRAQQIVLAIRSAENQTFKPLEIIVVDDASTDNTREIVEGLDSEVPIVYKLLDRNCGGGRARNVGVESAKAKFVAFLDSDDQWLASHLENFLPFVDNLRDEKFLVAARARIDGTSRVLPIGHYPSDDGVGAKLHYVLTGGLAFQTSTILLPRKTALKFSFDESLRRHQDWDLTFRLIEAHVPIHLLSSDTVLYQYGTSGNVSRSTAVRPSLRFLLKHRGHMNSKSVLRFLTLEVQRRKPSKLGWIIALIRAYSHQAISLREFVSYGLRG